MMLGYRIELTPDNDTFLVTCPQLPIVATFGETEDEARSCAIDAIEIALASMIDDDEDIPHPDGADGEIVALPLLTAFKLNLYWALRSTGITRAELAGRLQWNPESVDRLFRLDHKSRLEQIEAAFAALGRVVELDVHEARAA
jgi:antitoxin HicB